MGVALQSRKNVFFKLQVNNRALAILHMYAPMKTRQQHAARLILSDTPRLADAIARASNVGWALRGSGE
ncbi:unnamed protein product [Tetraodon nigroviridis]|uniref:(spotted green pufferfish) hypothetical protein n=1 Tax=Tetraodon nigroviridis TaxID=99883 RepID=Q4SM27_TETNG|nr:unnamed protein product [Tetraodon nigroviridis]